MGFGRSPRCVDDFAVPKFENWFVKVGLDMFPSHVNVWFGGFRALAKMSGWLRRPNIRELVGKSGFGHVSVSCKILLLRVMGMLIGQCLFPT